MQASLLSFLLSLACLSSCGEPSQKSKDQLAAPVFENTVNRGLAFTGVDLYYSSSDLLYYDYHRGLISGLLYGQSGDSALWWLDNELALFNRTPTYHNYVRYELSGREAFLLKQETSGDFEKGDPSHVLKLSNGHWLLSYFGKGQVVEIEPDTGKEVQKLDFSVDGPFHPSSMFKRSIAGVSYIFIAALGIEVDPANYKTFANGKQGIFLVREDASGLKVLNQGRPIAIPKASNPGFYHTDEVAPLVAGLCFAGTKGCKQSIEFLDVYKAVNGVSFDEVLVSHRYLDENLFTMNGSLSDGFEPNSLFANVVANKNIEPFKKGEKYLISIQNKEPISIDMVHHYSHPDSSGSYLLLTDKGNGTLYFGDLTANRQPSLNILHNETKKVVLLKRIPYHGVLIPK